MKHVYPPRHPASLDVPAPAPRRPDTAGRADRDATGGADTGRNAATEPVRNDPAPPQRGPDTPPR